MISKEDFMKVWKDTSRENILNQFYHDYKTLREEYEKWNELKKCVRQWILYHSVCEEDYKELNVLEDVESKMQELEKKQ